MRAFVKKQQQSHQQISANLTRPGAAASARRHSALHLQIAIGNQAVQGVLQGNNEGSKAGSAATGLEEQAHTIGTRLGSLLPGHDSITSPRLPGSVRQAAENYLGVDLSDVQLRSDRESRREVSRAGADARTVGSEISFAGAAPGLESTAERNLLGHELVHVAQQKKMGASPPQYRARECGAGTGSAESRFADNNPGFVFNLFAPRTARPGQPSPPAEELLLWNFCPGRRTPRTTHVRELSQAAQRWQLIRATRPQLRIRVIGGASGSGTARGNEALSFGRTQEVKRVLETSGFPGTHIDTEGVGTRNPLAPETSPENMARNRRVEVVLYAPVTTAKIPWAAATVSGGQVGRVQDRPAQVAPRIRLNASFTNSIDDRGNILGIRGLGAMFATANISLTSAAPVRAGFIQILTRDRRVGTMRQRGAANPRPLHLDYSHCMGRIIPCRDHHAPHHILLQGPGFFRTVDLNRAGSTSGLAMANDSPGVGMPLRWPNPQAGPFFLRHISWDMEFMLMTAMVDETFGAIEVLQHAKWIIGSDGDITLRVGRGNRVVGHTVTFNRRLLGYAAFKAGAPTGLDIAKAASGPTCRMGAREGSVGLQNLPCMPFES